mgnify:CR=1 FL=1
MRDDTISTLIPLFTFIPVTFQDVMTIDKVNNDRHVRTENTANRLFKKRCLFDTGTENEHVNTFSIKVGTGSLFIKPCSNLGNCSNKNSGV